MPAEVTVKVNMERCQLEVRGTSPKEVFEALAAYSFLSHRQCGKCQSTNTRFDHRVAQDKYHYFHVACVDCGARLDVGQHKDGDGLFVKEQKGWYMYEEDSDGSRPAPSDAEYSRPAGSAEVTF